DYYMEGYRAALASSPEPETAGESVVLDGHVGATFEGEPFIRFEANLPADFPTGPVRLAIQSTQGEAKA
ncbi:MAG: hypothetical protein RL272_1178, partial [Candidatus Parcubacteria bacterium]